MNTELTPADRLDDGKRNPEDILNLMTPPGGEIGFATPLHYDPSVDGASNEECVSGVIEFRGVMVFTYLAETGEWVMSDSMLGDVEGFFTLTTEAELFIESITSEIKSERTHEVTAYEQPITECRTPPGYTTKFAIPHEPLTTELIEQTTQQQNGYLQDVIPRYSSPTADDKVVSIISIEDEEIATSEFHVFMYYVPEFGTWRVLDATEGKADDDVVDRLHKDLSTKMVEYYGEYQRESALNSNSEGSEKIMAIDPSQVKFEL